MSEYLNASVRLTREWLIKNSTCEVNNFSSNEFMQEASASPTCLIALISESLIARNLPCDE